LIPSATSVSLGGDRDVHGFTFEGLCGTLGLYTIHHLLSAQTAVVTMSRK